MAKRVLVVDDEPSILKIIATQLRVSGYDVMVAMDGASALARIMESPPDLMILDVMLPKMNGYEVCTAVKQNPQLRHTPIIMFTALRGEQDYWKAMSCGADAYLTKPYSVDDLQQIVNRLINALDSGNKATEEPPADSSPASPTDEPHNV